MEKVGLVLEGGAMRGMYTAGVLDTFLDNDINVDGIVGTSAGALFGMDYIANQKGRTIKYNKKYAKDSRYMGMKSLLTTGNIINKDFAYYEVPLKLDIFDNEAFLKSSTELYTPVTNVETGNPEYYKITNPMEQIEILRAASSLPFVSRMVEWNGEKYLDGMISDSIPLNKCKELGYEKQIVVLTRPIDFRKSEKKLSELMTKLVYRKYPNLVKSMNDRNKKYNETLDRILELEKNGEIFVLRPSENLNIKKIERNENKLQSMYDLGVKDCKSKVKQLKKYIS